MSETLQQRLQRVEHRLDMLTERLVAIEPWLGLVQSWAREQAAKEAVEKEARK